MTTSQEEMKLPFDKFIIPEWAKSKVIDIYMYHKLHEYSLNNFEEFWSSMAKELDWFKPWERVLDTSNPPFYKWFVGGKLNLSYLAIDRHVKTWRRNKVAIIWEGEPVDERGNPLEIRKFTYYDLYREVNRVAYMLKRKFGIKKGDRVTFYMPHVPELPICMYAVWRIGAITNVVFSGYSAEALAERIRDSQSRLVITADGFWRRGKVIRLKEVLDKALERVTSVENVIVFPRLGLKDIPISKSRDLTWHDALGDVPMDAYVEPEPVESEHPSFILYTSGTMGKPKGIVHDTGGWAVKAYINIKWAFDPKEEDVLWTISDIGWVTGHTWVVLGPAILGLTQVMYQGAPDYPQPDRIWSIVERYGVTIMITAPTLVRMLMQYGDEWVKKRNTSTLRIMPTGGEVMNPEVAYWIYHVVGNGRILTTSGWGMTETGSGTLILVPGLGYLVPPKPGSCGPPPPGFDIDVVDEEGRPTPPGVKGYLVIKRPWPGMLLGIWGDPERYVKEYWSRFPGMFYTGDYAVKDKDGYIWVLGRADEVLKVAGHRISTYELESALTSYPGVVEAGVVGLPDPIKGEVPVAFVVLKQGVTPSEELKKELRDHVRRTIGPIAEPAHIIFTTKLPKTRTGKIVHRYLKAVAMDQPIGDLTILEDESAVEEIRRAYEYYVKNKGKI